MEMNSHQNVPASQAVANTPPISAARCHATARSAPGRSNHASLAMDASCNHHSGPPPPPHAHDAPRPRAAAPTPAWPWMPVATTTAPRRPRARPARRPAPAPRPGPTATARPTTDRPVPSVAGAGLFDPGHFEPPHRTALGVQHDEVQASELQLIAPRGRMADL